jgi:hypothetical protein
MTVSKEYMWTLADVFLPTANGRSVVFLTGVGIIWTFFIKSGNALRNSL